PPGPPAARRSPPGPPSPRGERGRSRGGGRPWWPRSDPDGARPAPARRRNRRVRATGRWPRSWRRRPSRRARASPPGRRLRASDRDGRGSRRSAPRSRIDLLAGEGKIGAKLIDRLAEEGKAVRDHPSHALLSRLRRGGLEGLVGGFASEEEQ